jgi:hypothetical protein
MDPTTILAAIASVISEAVQIGPTVITAAEDAEPFAQLIYSLFEGTTVTAAQITTLQTNLAALSAQLQQPLPADDGTTTT